MRLKFPVLAMAAVAALAGCVEPTAAPQTQPARAVPTATDEARYARVVSRMEPVIESECRARVSAQVNCDFAIILDDDPRKGANAYQTLDRSGRPILAFTTQILPDFQNDDELAFVLGHEAAHHIAGHIAQTRSTAVTGALLGGALAVVLGGGQSAVDIGVDLGSTVGARAYSKDHELEADRLGAILTQRSGYDALRGAQFFERIPDPGDRFLGTHPPNDQRIAVVTETVAGL
ncbi:M48 family metalloprotease [Cognatishimia sp.]|uniref:M48 family metalloprotease n=1 Tax=Cognatishimia sp. TaxID=2211648 RepID=UPI0035121FA2